MTAKLVEKLPRYSVTKLAHTCSIYEIGLFSTQHNWQGAGYHDNDFLPPSPTGLYCATFVKDDIDSDRAYKVINKSLKRIYQTLWKPNKAGAPGRVRFCLFKEKQDADGEE